ncbi:hypothetical protein MASR2M48_30320 [Spirochaetota bacterium]
MALPTFDMDRVLAWDCRDLVRAQAAPVDPELASEVASLIAQRLAAKNDKDFATADGIRNGLKARGIVLEDGPSGTTWKMGPESTVSQVKKPTA